MIDHRLGQRLDRELFGDHENRRTISGSADLSGSAHDWQPLLKAREICPAATARAMRPPPPPIPAWRRPGPGVFVASDIYSSKVLEGF
jgi:hypothetical protein